MVPSGLQLEYSFAGYPQLQFQRLFAPVYALPVDAASLSTSLLQMIHLSLTSLLSLMPFLSYTPLLHYHSQAATPINSFCCTLPSSAKPNCIVVSH